MKFILSDSPVFLKIVFKSNADDGNRWKLKYGTIFGHRNSGSRQAGSSDSFFWFPNYIMQVLFANMAHVFSDGVDECCRLLEQFTLTNFRQHETPILYTSMVYGRRPGLTHVIRICCLIDHNRRTFFKTIALCSNMLKRAQLCSDMFVFARIQQMIQNCFLYWL